MWCSVHQLHDGVYSGAKKKRTLGVVADEKNASLVAQLSNKGHHS